MTPLNGDATSTTISQDFLPKHFKELSSGTARG
ncbi:MAG: hypothetical protein ACI8P0_002684 [Planctomycetaceae bacterium]|jgi:hypothetical protein